MERRINLETLNQVRRSAGAFIRKWRIPLLFGALGVVLLLFPGGKKEKTETKPAEVQSDCAFSLERTQREMEEILSQIEGAGRVQVMLSVSGGEERVYQQDERQSELGSTERSTVFQSAGSSEKTPVVTTVRYPRFLGALVVCDGADSAALRLAMVEAVSGLTGLGSDKITVIKMKHQ